jgi:hypothetical protein
MKTIDIFLLALRTSGSRSKTAATREFETATKRIAGEHLECAKSDDWPRSARIERVQTAFRDE